MLNLGWEIFDDFLEPIKYIPMGIIYGSIIMFLFYTIRRLLYRKTEMKMERKELLEYWLFFLYLSMVMIITFFSREPGTKDGIDMRLFSTWGVTANDHAYVLENVIMLFPLGIFLPLLFKGFRRAWATIWIGMLLSVTIETLQLITSRGHCQLDDVVANTIGTILGYICWYAFGYIQRKNNSKV